MSPRPAMLMLLLACGASDQRPKPATHATPETACATERSRFDALAREGRLEKLAQATSARVECAELEPQARALHAKALADLETSDPEGDLRRAIEIQKSDPIAARRAFDRASRGLEKAAGRALAVETSWTPVADTLPTATFSPNGRWVAGLVSSRMLVVDTLQGRPLLSLECDHWARAVFGDDFVATVGCFGAPDDRPRYADEIPALKIFALPDATTLTSANAHAVAVSKSLVAMADWKELVLFDVSKRAVVWKSAFASKEPAAPLLAFDDTGSRLLVRDPDRHLSIVAVSDGHRIQSLAGESRGAALAFAPDGSIVEAVPSGNEVVSWNLASGRRTPSKIASAADRITFARDGKSVVLWSPMWMGASEYELPSWKPLPSRPFASGTVEDVVATSAGFRAIASTDAGIVVADLAMNGTTTAATKKPTHRFGGALNADGTKWAVVDGDEWDEGPPLRVGEVGHAGRAYPMAIQPWRVGATTISDDRSLLAMQRETIDLLQLPSARVAVRIPSPRATRMRFSPSHDALAVVEGLAVTVYDASTGTKRFTTDAVYDAHVAFDPRGALLAMAPADGPVTIVDAHTGRVVRVEDTSMFGNRIGDLGFSNATTVVAGGYDEAWTLDTARPHGAWGRAAASELDAVVPERRCKTANGKTAHDALTSIPDAVTADCTIAVARDGDELRLLSFPTLEGGVVIEGVSRRDEMFVRPFVRARDTSIRHVDPRVQLIGAHAREIATCRLGPRVLPVELCDERFFDDGLLATFFRH